MTKQLTPVERLKADLEELDLHAEYKKKLERILKIILEKESNCIASFKITTKDRPTPPLEVEFADGTPIPWDGLPEQFKSKPYMVIPGARVKEFPKHDEEFDIVLDTPVLCNFFIFLLRKMEAREKVLEERLNKPK
jgi:hypothetical protein